MATQPESVMRDYSDLPVVLVAGEDVGSIAAFRDAVAAAGGRTSATLPVSQLLERIDSQATLAAVVIDVREDHGAEHEALFDRLDRGARERRFCSVVEVPMALLDVAMARLASSGTEVLCEPSEAQRSEAIASALAQPRFRLADVGPGLKELADEVARIAKTLATLASEDLPRASNQPAAARTANGQAVDAALIRALIRARRLRTQYFPAELFADPAWDMLLDLAAARLEGRAVAVSSLCIASAVPPTTALRWIKTLSDAKLFARVADSNDGRRVFIELTEVAENGIMAYLTALQRILTLTK